MSADTQALVVATDACRTFGSGPAAVVAVHGLSCRLYPGDRVAVMGPSGSGKSTLLHLLAGLEVPSAGTVSWPALGPRHALRPGPVAMVFQAPSLMPALDVTENVALPLLLADTERAETNARAHEALAALGLTDLAHRVPDELSGGQAQRVAVARALAGRPALLLADEPTGQLDHVTGMHLVDGLLAAADRSGAALVVATHDPLVAERLQVRWDIDGGRLWPVGTTACSA